MGMDGTMETNLEVLVGRSERVDGVRSEILVIYGCPLRPDWRELGSSVDRHNDGRDGDKWVWVGRRDCEGIRLWRNLGGLVSSGRVKKTQPIVGANEMQLLGSGFPAMILKSLRGRFISRSF